MSLRPLHPWRNTFYDSNVSNLAGRTSLLSSPICWAILYTIWGNALLITVQIESRELPFLLVFFFPCSAFHSPAASSGLCHLCSIPHSCLSKSTSSSFSAAFRLCFFLRCISCARVFCGSLFSSALVSLSCCFSRTVLQKQHYSLIYSRPCFSLSVPTPGCFQEPLYSSIGLTSQGLLLGASSYSWSCPAVLPGL
jgi:hypothetical protein